LIAENAPKKSALGALNNPTYDRKWPFVSFSRPRQQFFHKSTSLRRT